VLNHFGTLLSVCVRVLLSVCVRVLLGVFVRVLLGVHTYVFIINTYLLPVLRCYAYRLVNVVLLL
jgi:hypothetical protein